jgi:hypothetical protein
MLHRCTSRPTAKSLCKEQHGGKMKEHFDLASLIVIVITFVSFVIALFTKGLTHDLLLEVAVFLVSVKLILMAYRNSVTSKEILSELKAIRKKLDSEHDKGADNQ